IQSARFPHPCEGALRSAARSVVESGLTGGIHVALLGSGGTAAPERESLALLPSGPDAVRTLSVRGTRSSTPRAQTLARRTVPRTAFGPAWSGFRVQGTADSPPSAAEQAEGTTSPRDYHRRCPCSTRRSIPTPAARGRTRRTRRFVCSSGASAP